MTSDDEAVERLAALAHEAASAPMGEAQDREASLALVARMEQKAEAKPRRWLPAVALAAAFAIGIGALVARSWPRPLGYEVRGAATSGPYVHAAGSRPALVVFTDGSRVEAEPGTRFRVEEPKSSGARVLLERGHASVSIVHRDGSSWSFAAGPFDVRVTGTRFDISWDPERESVDLVLREGSVEVRGPLTDVPLAVRRGQRFRADLRSRTMTVIDGPEPVVSAPSEPTETATPPGPGAAPASRGSSGEPAKSGPAAAQAPTPAAASVAQETARDSWSKLVAAGKFETVVRHASERGTSAVMTSGSASDLRALADAARYTGRSDLAREALMALRARFSGAAEERSAAFLLGRLEEAAGAAARAGRWYETYLHERPNGELSAEALAGRMRAVSATSGRRAAAPLARDYLSRYPDGVHAEAARAVLSP